MAAAPSMRIAGILLTLVVSLQGCSSDPEGLGEPPTDDARKAFWGSCVTSVSCKPLPYDVEFAGEVECIEDIQGEQRCSFDCGGAEVDPVREYTCKDLGGACTYPLKLEGGAVRYYCEPAK